MIDFKDLHDRTIPHIEQLLSHFNIDTKLVGKQLQYINPLRNDSDFGSASINIENGIFKDFADDSKGGDLITFVANILKTKPTQAAEYLELFLLENEGQLSNQTTSEKTSKVDEMVQHVVTVAKQTKSTSNLILPIPPDTPAPHESNEYLTKATMYHVYHDANANRVCYIYRFDKSDVPKSFVPQTLHKAAAGRLLWKPEGLPTPRPLYNLHLLKQRLDAEIVICEGEKAADAAQSLLPDTIVMTTMNGAKSANKTDFGPLAGRKVTIWPDNDSVGDDYAKDLIFELRQVDHAMQIRILKPLMYKALSTPDGLYDLGKISQLAKGWDAADALLEGWQPEHFAKIWSEDAYFVEVELREFSPPYVISKSGIFIIEEFDNKTRERKICSYLKILAETRDAGGQNWGLLVELKDSDNNIHKWAMPRELLTSQGFQFVQSLTKLGLKIGIGDKSKEQVAIYLNDYETKARALCVTQQGWYQETFVGANGMIGPSTDMVVVQSSHPEDLRVFREQHTHADWCRFVADYCNGNSRLVFSICSAFASSILFWLNEENGGFHLKGNSSIGKTVALNVAVSVWGGADFMQRWRATSNGLEGTATRFNDTFLALDEINQIDPAQAGETAYMLGNGQGKLRATTSGVIRLPTKWRLIFLSSGEITLSDHLVASGKKVMAGQEVRMVNIPADPGAGFGLFENLHEVQSPTLFAEMLRSNAAKYYGTAGPMWIELLADPKKRANILSIVKQVKADFIATYVSANSAGQVFRVAGRFGLVAAVGEACISYGILPWAQGSAISATKECFLSWLELRGGNGSHESDVALLQVRKFIETHGESRFTAWDELSARDDGLDTTTRTINRVGFRRVMDDGNIHYYIFSESFNREVCQGLDSRQVAKLLLEKNYLVTGNDGKPQSVHRLPGIEKPARVYCISSAILVDAEPVLEAEHVTQAA